MFGGFIYQLLQSDPLTQMEVTFSALKRLLMGPNEVTLKNLVHLVNLMVNVAKYNIECLGMRQETPVKKIPFRI